MQCKSHLHRAIVRLRERRDWTYSVNRSGWGWGWRLLFSGLLGRQQVKPCPALAWSHKRECLPSPHMLTRYLLPWAQMHPIWQMQKLRPTEGNRLVYSHTASEELWRHQTQKDLDTIEESINCFLHPPSKKYRHLEKYYNIYNTYFNSALKSLFCWEGTVSHFIYL